jgi:hypothetical protein
MPDPNARPAYLVVDSVNTGSAPITVTSVSFGAESEQTTTRAWVVPSIKDDPTTVAIAGGLSPTDGWADRRPVGHAVIAAGKHVGIEVVISFAPGQTEPSKNHGVIVHYRTGDGTTYAARSAAFANIHFTGGC